MENNGNQNQTPDNHNNTSPLREFFTIIWDLVVIFVIAFVIIAPFRIFIAEPFVVSGSSMIPNFHNRDYLIVDRLTYRSHSPQRGDVIVLKYPKDTTQYFIKRIIGLPGETVCFRQGHVVISQMPLTAEQCAAGQGAVLTEPYLPSQSETIGATQPVTLGSGEYFVLGDNRTASSDSRVWGILPQDDIVGRVWARVFPLSDAGLIPRVNYH